ncbi:GAF domain-containing protein [Leptothoe kymatousa]|uniref:GAF domain-containing protein n=1 Tax=Leptothoe kymatousa TAU-MAC 1615 TaxID=2364775 RepID=A0ABS5Y0G3_9CYAN|nr:GAF domain-containing protein [Leptothoe kymatousa]MBT9310949.1 GAF domain-containing protein [Leptothoe kymatousa TAU-MAC 1615]
MNSNHYPQPNNGGDQAEKDYSPLSTNAAEANMDVAAPQKQLATITQVGAKSPEATEQEPVTPQNMPPHLQRGPRWQVLLLTILFSLPLVIGIAALMLWLKQPLVGALLGSIVTALVGSLIISRRRSSTELYQTLKYDEMDLLEVDNNRLSAQLADITQQKDQIAQQYQLLSMLAFRVRQIPEQSVLFETLVKGLRDLLDTDRVIVYRFNPDWSGTIIAESVNPQYPASLDETIGDPCFHQRHAVQYANGRTRAIADIYEEPGLTDCHIRMLEQYRVRANLVVPIRQNDALYGLLIAHHCRAPRSWADTELNMMTQIVTEVEYHIGFLTQTQQYAQQNRQAQLLSMLAFRVRQIPERHILFETAVEGLRDLLDTDRVVIYWFNPDWSGTIVAESVDPRYPASLDETIGDPCFHQRHAAQYKDGRTRAIADIYKEPGLTDCHIRMLEQYRVRANLVVPVRWNDQLVGLMIAHHCRDARYWSEDELSLTSQVATEIEYQLDFIIQNQQKTASASHAWFLGDIAFRARQTNDLDDLFKSTVKGLRQLLSTDRVMVYKFNPDWTGTMVAESVGSDFMSVLNEKIDDPCFRGRYVDLYRNGRVRGINNIRKEPGLTECHVRLLEKYEVKANLIAPLRLKDELFGLLIAHQCSAPRTWTSEDLDIVAQTSTQLGYALEHLHSLRDLESSVERSRLFGDIAFRTRQSLDVDAVMRIVLEGGIKMLRTNRLLIYRFNDDWSGTMTHEAVSSERWPRVLNTKIFDPCFKGRYVDLYRNGRVRPINDIYQEPGLSDCHIRTLEQYDVKANLVAPIRMQGELYGLLIAHHCDGARVWTQADIEFLSELATQTEYALGHLDFISELENARHTAEQVSSQQRHQRETIQHQLTDLRQSLEVAFKGDLRARAIVPEGDIGIFASFLNESIEHLQQLVQEVRLASETMTQTADGNQINVAKLSKATLRQSDELAEAMQTVEAIANEIQQVDSNAQSAQLKVQQADQVFQAGDQAMNRAVDSISLLQTKVEETAQQVKRLGEASQNISRVVNLIRDLAGQTNVLALNASIEANSSGDQSQGFGIVAEEVRSLAEQSTVATREIETLVEEIQTETNQVVSTMESWSEDVTESMGLVETSRQRLNSISTLGGEIRILVEAIAQATLVQNQAATSVSHTVQDVRQISQENSHLAVSVADSFQQLLDVANRLQARIDQFKVH